jgi:hypothetical protein
MDPDMQVSLGRLLTRFEAALGEVRAVSDNDGALDAWRRVQTLGWELSALLPVPARKCREDRTLS